MLLLEKVSGQIRRSRKEAGTEEPTLSWDRREFAFTHTVDTTGPGRKASHVIRIFKPNPAAGPLAGEMVASFTFTNEQAKELKAHL